MTKAMTDLLDGLSRVADQSFFTVSSMTGAGSVEKSLPNEI